MRERDTNEFTIIHPYSKMYVCVYVNPKIGFKQ